MLAPGTVFSFALPNGMKGSCRVLRGPRQDEPHRSGHWLVCATPCIGTVDVRSKDLRKILCTKEGPTLAWMHGEPPPSFARVGVVPVPASDASKTCFTSAPWEMLPNVVHRHWRSLNEPTGLARDRESAKRDAEKQLAAEVAAIASREKIDLTGFVPLPTPKKERTPEEVLHGFIASMNRWEKECARIDAGHVEHIAVHMSGSTLRAIFEEFCTRRERKQGRIAHYTSPPEYDPKRETITRTTNVSRRVEIETTRGRCYVLLKTRDGWLIDNVRVDGRPAIL